MRCRHLNDEDYDLALAAQLFEQPKMLEVFNLARANADTARRQHTLYSIRHVEDRWG